MVRSYKWIEVAQYITGTDESFLTGATPKASHLVSTAKSGCATFRWRISASADSKATLSPIKPDLLILRDLLANFMHVHIPWALEMFHPTALGWLEVCLWGQSPSRCCTTPRWQPFFATADSKGTLSLIISYVLILINLALPLIATAHSARVMRESRI
jgi:hypothetical protein